MHEDAPRPEDGACWEIKSPFMEDLSSIDERMLGGHLDKTIQKFVRSPPKLQDRLVQRLLTQCRVAEYNTMIHDCSGYELRLHVLHERRSLVLLGLMPPATLQ